MLKIALEDLITVVCEYFCENIEEISNNFPDETFSSKTIYNRILWYSKRSNEEKRKISEKLLDIIEKDYKKHGQNSDRKRSFNKKMQSKM